MDICVLSVFISVFVQFFSLLRDSDTDDGFLYLTTKHSMKVLVVLARHTKPEDSNQLQRGELTTARRSTNAFGS